jgi:antitoxin ChpS
LAVRDSGEQRTAAGPEQRNRAARLGGIGRAVARAILVPGMLYFSTTEKSMATATFRNLGGSIVLAVPKKILDLVDLDAGSKVDVSIEHGRLIVAPRKKPKYTLDELLARCRPSDLKPGRRDKKWLAGSPVGKELI